MFVLKTEAVGGRSQTRPSSNFAKLLGSGQCNFQFNLVLPVLTVWKVLLQFFFVSLEPRLTALVESFVA